MKLLLVLFLLSTLGACSGVKLEHYETTKNEDVSNRSMERTFR